MYAHKQTYFQLESCNTCESTRMLAVKSIINTRIEQIAHIHMHTYRQTTMQFMHYEYIRTRRIHIKGDLKLTAVKYRS